MHSDNQNMPLYGKGQVNHPVNTHMNANMSVQANDHMNMNANMTLNKSQWMHACHQYKGANVEFEMSDGKTYQGKIHSHDHDNMYIIMNMPQQNRQEEERFFPFFGGFGFPFFAGGFGPGFGVFGFPYFGFRGFRRFWW
ncbi:hypothetical protein A374_09029 [Fictibacillus macauensis ZFHKF-1]|uniref:Uncharacterized protein n=1 Tax=Fictibacillus macauensis ZFHKF-1 TaxID=1196324 RepID=I8AJM4_9BACL|nr:hypothetical protein [Fictibacillus macauensis]EIT85967.1 hypothetical protein A374_09029 [Fictibacillus macauensis ZFHKF-1]